MNNCIICNKNSFNKIYNNTLLKCSNCGFVTANLTIDASTLKAIYSENYFKGEEYLDYIADKVSIQKNFANRLKDIKLDKNSPHQLLEIGCAYGFFAEVFTTNYPNYKYTGIDIVNEAIEYGKIQLNQNIYLADYLSFNTDSPYSDVFMWDVIEHLPNPQLFIEKVSKEILPNGHLYITTGDIGRILPKLQKSKWRMIHPPSHLHYFSKNTLSDLLIKNGFEIVSIKYPSVYRSARQIFYSLFILNKKESGIKMKLYNLIPKGLFIPLNTFDIMFVTAKKRSI